MKSSRSRVSIIGLSSCAVAAIACGGGAPSTTSSTTEGALASDDAARASATAGSRCAWPYKNDLAAGNLAIPDTSSTYFTMPYVLAAGEALVVRGVYPKARYFSFTTYDSKFDAVDHAADSTISPSEGGNPFAGGAQPGGRYEIVVKPGAHAAGGGDVLAAGGSALFAFGVLMLRVYLPDDPADLTGSGGLPSVSVRGPLGRERAMATCATQAPNPALRAIAAAVFPDATHVPPPTPTFTRAPFASLFPNPDVGYVGALFEHAPGRVLVVRGKAPTYPDTEHGASPAAPADVRYFSICQNAYVKPYPVVACAHDATLPLDARGEYTVVVSTPEDRPPNANAANGVAWLPFGDTAHPGYVVLRNMLPAASFATSTMAVPVNAVADASNMGAYAPVGKLCGAADFAARGAAGCGF